MLRAVAAPVSQGGTGGGAYLPLTGGTLTGDLTVTRGDPTGQIYFGTLGAGIYADASGNLSLFGSSGNVVMVESNGTLSVETGIWTGGDLNVAGTIYANGALTVSGNTQLAGLWTTHDANIGGALHVNSDIGMQVVSGGDARQVIFDPNGYNVISFYQSLNTFYFAIGGANIAHLDQHGTLTLNGSAISVGVIDGSTAAAGNVGEYQSASFTTAVSIATSGAIVNVGSLALSAGDWDVEGTVTFNNPANPMNTIQAAVNTASAALPVGTAGGIQALRGSFTSGAAQTLGTTRQRFPLAAATPIYLVASASYGSGPAVATGFLAARRVR